MPSPRSRKRITVVASAEGIERAESALIRHGFESQTNFAKSQLIARTAVSNFFNRKGIQPDTFKKICEELKLNWLEVLEENSEKLEDVEQPQIPDQVVSIVAQGGEPVQTASRQIAITNQQNETVVIVLEGSLSSVDANFRATLEVLLKNYAGATIQITDMKSGSIRIKIQGSQEDVTRLVKLVESGELSELNELPVEAIEISSRRLLEDTKTVDSASKWNLIQEIANYPIAERQLVNTDLSNADLSNADLRGTSLSNADLRGTSLRGADLRGANLRGTDLHEANLYGANLRGADLREANLHGANLYGANLRGADLRGTDLHGANLHGANLRGANLHGANLHGANLREANLHGADLRGADLRGDFLRETDLREADLFNANLYDAIVEQADFSGSRGLSKADKLDLIRRGAIFNDALGDRESSPSPTRR
jgi:uncharacterized protein YjbI with pentapeptide repeats